MGDSELADHNFELRLFEDHIYFRDGQSTVLDPAIRVIYVIKGPILVNGTQIEEGQGVLEQGEMTLQIADDVTEYLRWELLPAGSPVKDILSSFKASDSSYGQSLNKRADFVNLPDAETGIRLDTVTFPPGTRAYRHVHASCGIRYILRGNLEINTDEGLYLVEQGQAWFEGANSPVLAIASEEVETQFVRLMLLPVDYHGKLTITYVDPADDDKPRENINNRLLDEIVKLSTK
jgi:quercetin dioxygenase-like cupin family protein